MAKKSFSGDLDELPPVEKKSEAEIKKSIEVLAELQEFIPPLWGEELEQLTQNILAEGCRDPLVLWENNQGQYILIDGHNRYRICMLYQLDFKIVLKEFTGLDEVKDWMINNQLGKRNMTEEQKSYYRGLQYKREKKRVGENQYATTAVDNLTTPQKTHEKLAEIHKVSAKTIQRDEKFAEALDKIVGQDKELKWDLLTRKITIPKASLQLLADQDEPFLDEFRQKLKAGETTKPWIEQLKPATLSLSEIEIIQQQVVQDIKQAIKEKDKSLIDKAIQQLQKLRKKL